MSLTRGLSRFSVTSSIQQQTIDVWLPSLMLTSSRGVEFGQLSGTGGLRPQLLEPMHRSEGQEPGGHPGTPTIVKNGCQRWLRRRGTPTWTCWVVDDGSASSLLLLLVSLHLLNQCPGMTFLASSLEWAVPPPSPTMQPQTMSLLRPGRPFPNSTPATNKVGWTIPEWSRHHPAAPAEGASTDSL